MADTIARVRRAFPVQGWSLKGVKKIRKRSDAPKVNRPWTLAERETVMAAASPQFLLPRDRPMGRPSLGRHPGDAANRL
ncbi:hypothetical protein [Kaistia adipata]|uniref:hypothetical protein n=1 Tax=Kaistia adipata TaxID=166954 RepID=UPI0012EB2E31|nr:hypothetical protein [Kaistia adipata]